MKQYKQTLENFEKLENATFKLYGLDSDLKELMPYFNNYDIKCKYMMLDDPELKKQLKDDIFYLIYNLLDVNTINFDDAENIEKIFKNVRAYLFNNK